MSPACTACRDALASLVDADPAALDAHGEHLATCEACRDARHDAQALARAVSVAGADHVAAEDVAARLLAAIDAAAVASSPSPSPSPSSPSSSPSSSSSRARRWPIALAIGAATAAAAGGVVALRGGEAPKSEAPVATRAVVPTAAAKLARIDRAGAGAGGVERWQDGAWQPVAAGAALPADARLRTDAHSRAHVEVAGHRVVVDADSELTLGATWQLERGRLVADLAHEQRLGDDIVAGPARLMLTRADAQTQLRVVRGVGAIAGVEVRAGEEGVARAGTPVRVVAVPQASSELAWAERPDAVDAAAPSGLGSLRAYKPGEQRDRDWNLALAEHTVSVKIAGPIARTEITETFRNDSGETLEGVFQFPLPPDAKIDDLALDVPGGFEHGAFVEKARAEKIWQGVIDKAKPKALKRGPDLVTIQETIWVPGPWKDPALLDWQRGGRVELRIFPIPAGGARTIKVAYTQVVAPRGERRQYAYPLAAAADASTTAEKFAVEVEVRGGADVKAAGYPLTAGAPEAGVTRLAFAQGAFVPRGDLIVSYTPGGADAEVRAWTFAGGAAVAPDEDLAEKRKVGNDPAVLAAQRAIAGDLRPTAVLAIKPELPRWREVRPRDYAIVVDASHSMIGERWRRAQALLGRLAAGLDGRDRVTVLACDDECTSVGALAAADAARATELGAFLGAVSPGGASDPVAAVRAAAAAVPAAAGRERWVLYVGDGGATTGLRRVADIEDAISELVAKDASLRVGAVAIGHDADAAVLAAIARGGGGSAQAWTPGRRVADVAAATLDATAGVSLRGATIELPAGLVDLAPTKLPSIVAGDEVLVAARLAGGPVAGDLILRGTVGGERFEQRYRLDLGVAAGAGNRFVPKAWASLAIDELDRSPEAEDRVRAVAMSQAFGVMSRHTSLLVLESQAMFDAFGIDRGRGAALWTGEDEVEEVTAVGQIDMDPAVDASVASGRAAAKPMGKSAESGAGGAMADKAKDDDSTLAQEDRWAPPPPDEAPARPAPTSIAPARRPLPGEIAVTRTRVMQRVWNRVAGITGPMTVDAEIAERARAALAAAPDSRERHRDLVQALAFAGELAEAAQVAEAWRTRDALDPQALEYQADLLGRQGARDRALRALGSTIDLDPDRIERHERLALALTEAGRLRQACGHRLAIASIGVADTSRVAAAMRCARAIGQDGDAARIARMLPSDVARVAAERLATAAAAPNTPRGDLVVRARWDGEADLDLSVVTGTGRRWSWQGGKSDLSVDGALGRGAEALGVRRLPKGAYRIELARPGSAPAGIVRGTVEIVALGQRQTLPFELIGDRVVVGDVRVRMESRLVEVAAPTPRPQPRPRPVRRPDVDPSVFE